MEKSNIRVFILITALGILLSACSQVGQGLSPTDTAEPEPALVPATDTPIPPSPTNLKTLTPSATVEPTSTPTKVPQISVDENTHCRSGPGVVYPSKGVLLGGEVAEVIGRSTVTDYW
ncbi:MAG: hypothetical protein IMY80_02575, partial [Chloroflexi bacterium]|nr:hypothetical protein [Chloroflexota bacterium]